MAESNIKARAAPNEVAPAETPEGTTLLTMVVAVTVIAALYFGREVFLPIVLAMLLGFVLAPFVDLLRSWRFGRVPSVVVAVLVALGIIGGLAGVIGSQLAQLAGDLPRYGETIRDKAGTLRAGTIGRASEFLKHFGREIERATGEEPARGAPPSPTQSTEPQKPLPVEIRERPLGPMEVVRTVIAPVLHPLATVGITFVVLIFILMQREDLRDRMIRLFGAKDLHRTTVAMDDAARRLSRFYLTQLALNAAFGVWITVGLWLIGVPNPILWGIFTALMRFVPYIGAFASAILPIALAAAVDPGWSMAVWAMALFLISEPIMGHVIEPLVYGQSTGLSPFAVVVSAIFWTWLWGPIGLLLATPLTLCMVVLGRHVERLEFLDVILGDRPALTPAENFYQRMLARDADEALEQAEQLLKERSLSSYYDEVALKGLQLAANDASRGVLGAAQLEHIKDAIKGLIGDLASHPDVEPPAVAGKEDPAGPQIAEKALPKQEPVQTEAPATPDLPEVWRGEAPVMCIAGRGPLDEAAATMLCQLLRKHGIGSRVVPHDAVSRSNIIGLDVNGVAMVCISYLDISGNPAHLRYLLKRLRQKLGKAPILVGLWPAEEAVLTDQGLRSAIGADYYVSSLREAVEACLEAAHKATGEEKAPGSDAAATPEKPSKAPASPKQIAAE